MEISAFFGARSGAGNKLLQIHVEPIGPGPIYTSMPQDNPQRNRPCKPAQSWNSSPIRVVTSTD